MSMWKKIINEIISDGIVSAIQAHGVFNTSVHGFCMIKDCPTFVRMQL